ncbi:TrmB family transcriptional regulator [Methanosphaerula palustris]|uniref:Transcriptional regulator, TrmB n=1 Tax=Methanosphaerula palustris (strain ATCC BAA-1556 / DSM 19958 / E1-9c) TaxID=521011 RepID=B8GJ82_METPE|nr:helix-turn-helix domain-containing protein [Methanosphaerula palustris]ACL15655.1 transcriptional regulator, TrmB [Methanosphaerula palustris E1-9c]
MMTITPALVKALKVLGLSEYQAKVYAALVLLDQAQAKEVIELLGISKPSVYESLDSLDDLGLAVRISAKPAVFQAISPEIAVKILMDTHTRAGTSALTELQALQQQTFSGRRSGRLWAMYGKENLDYKIDEMLREAKESVFAVISDRYLDLFKQIAGRGLQVWLVVISEDPEIEEELHTLFCGDHEEVLVTSPMVLMIPLTTDPDLAEMTDEFRFSNQLDLIVDDAEALSVPPIETDLLTGLDSQNRTVVLLAKNRNMMIWQMLQQMVKEELSTGDDRDESMSPLSD